MSICLHFTISIPTADATRHTFKTFNSFLIFENYKDNHHFSQNSPKTPRVPPWKLRSI